MKFFVFMLVMLFSLPAHAICVITNISTSNPVLTYINAGNGYNPYGSANPVLTGTILVQGVAGVACRYYVRLSGGGMANPNARGAAYLSDTIQYNFYTNASRTNIWDNTGGYGSANVFYGTGPTLAVLPATTHTFYWSVPPGQLKQSTSGSYYTDTITATLYQEVLAGFTEAGTVNFTVNIPVVSSVDVSVGATDTFNIANTTYTMDMGDLHNGVTKDFRTVVRSNSGHKLHFSSANNQKLKHVSATDTIDYDITFNGSLINLSSGTPVLVRDVGGVTAAAGQSYRSDVTIKNRTGLEMIGHYRDVINVTVSAQ